MGFINPTLPHFPAHQPVVLGVTLTVDLRKAFDGLAILVRKSLGHDPLDGSQSRAHDGAAGRLNLTITLLPFPAAGNL
jgi:hypothetical protein